mmetsp:Transcript_32990/g.90992  ORF Transcript_32990/g.90992 Transcript_32990/m.90992 type:complete len:298 (-) Transcript_32990:122-1015(-)
MDACKGGDASGGEPARSHDDGPEPKGVPPTAASGPAEAGRKRMNRSFGSAAFWSIMLGILGFVPAYAVFMVDGGWYLDAFLRRNPEDAMEAEHMWGGVWMAGIGIHAITGIGWTLAAFHQVITGATGPPGGRHKALHRRAGYPAALLGLFVAAEALVLQCLKPFTLSNYTPIVVNGALIILNLVVGIRHVQKKRYAEHKVAMAWTCAWTSFPGGVRVAIYLFNISGDCPIASHGTRNYGMVTLDVLLVLVPVAIVSCAMGRSRSWIFAVNVISMVLIVAVDIYNAIGASIEGLQCDK